MDINVIDIPTKKLIAEIDKKLHEFNVSHWEVKEVKPLAVTMNGADGRLVAGVTARTFGYWLLIDNLWVSEELRGKNIGSDLLSQLEAAAIKRGCKYAMLDTLNFQAKPFYEKFGYQIQWTQEHYPQVGCKYFMTKTLK